MFPKGPRFPAVKVPQVPGPNSYNPQDPEYDAYKRGAFLEKTDRFSKENIPEGPGPGTYDPDAGAANTNGRSSSRTGKPMTDRSAALQRKVEELERIHTDGKKSHHLDIERLKLELSRAQKSAAEHSDRASKLKKQNDAMDVRVQELKKAAAQDQADLREMRVKLRMAEHERAQAVAKQGETGEAKQALQATEARRKEETRERDRKIAELEKALSSESKRRALAEARLADIKGKGDGELVEARAVAKALKAELEIARSSAEHATAALAGVEAQTDEREEELLLRLEQHRATMARVVEEYAKLVAATVPKAAHASLKDDCLKLRTRIFRLERKVLNTEDQVTELANLVRFTKEDNALLRSRLRDAELEAAYYARIVKESADEKQLALHDTGLEESLLTTCRELARSQNIAHQIALDDQSLWADFYRLRTGAVLFSASGLLKVVDEAHTKVDALNGQLQQVQEEQAKLSATVEAAEVQHIEGQQRLAEVMAELQVSKCAEEAAKKQSEEARASAQIEVGKVEQALRVQKEANQRLAETVRKHKAAEDAAQAEVEQLASDLCNAERYVDAYNGLLEEVEGLMSRNSLAEEEAHRLSKFNAEILGHNNPNQRIMYVDRIRRELYDTKQRLLVATRDRDTAITKSEDLCLELEMYKSVAVPQELKPRTAVTRVARSAFIQSISNEGSVRASESSKSANSLFSHSEKLGETEHGRGDLTLDELL